MGGMHGFGPVVTPGSEQPYREPWEARIFALSTLVSVERLGKGPGGRPVREEMRPDEYLRASYYERWIYSTERRLERAGTIESSEVERWMERLGSGEDVPRSSNAEQAAKALEAVSETESLQPVGEARYAVGDRVRVRRMRPAGHTRCPRYVRGATGVIEAIRGNDPLPDIGPYKGPVQPVYAVAFDSEDLFGPSEEGRWTVMLDLFEDYLEDA
jgi:nitrile hydratase subunit beta